MYDKNYFSYWTCKYRVTLDCKDILADNYLVSDTLIIASSILHSLTFCIKYNGHDRGKLLTRDLNIGNCEY